jgi:hypothetical protein
MADADAYPMRAHASTEAPTGPAINTHALTPESWRRHRADRNRRKIARWLRQTAKRAHDTDPIRRRREALIHQRALAVHRDLLEIATLLERTPNADASCIATLHAMLANARDSPLYNPDIHVSELRATLYYARAGLMSRA